MRWATCFAVLVEYVYRIAVDQLPLPPGEVGERAAANQSIFSSPTLLLNQALSRRHQLPGS